MNAIDDNETRSTRAKYNRNARLYNLMEFLPELFWYRQWRQRLFAKMRGERFLEIGIGTGKNLRYYPADSLGVGVDLSEEMLARARAMTRERLVLVQTDAQRLPFQDHAFDAIVATFVFCSVPNPVAGLREIRRVLKSDGRLLLLEHVRPENARLARLFDRLNAGTVKRSGVHINRRTAENIRQAGFDLKEETNLLSTIFKLFVARPLQNPSPQSIRN